jgi:nucleotide-binding universal stress UspA family protein
MAIRTILTVTGTAEDDRDVRLAAGLCEEIGAHLSVLVTALAAPPPIGDYAAVISEAWLEERREDERRLKTRTQAVSSFVAGTSISADISSEYPDVASADETIGRRARYADIMVVGPVMLASDTLKQKIIEGALFSSGKPLLLVPEASKATLRPRRVVVAWDSGLEASRAVREAMDLLVAADDVRLVLVDPVAGDMHQGVEPGADAGAYLARHGVKVTVDRVPSEGRSVAEILSRHAVDHSADLLVMGGYGHSRLRQRLFGGVTKSMIEDQPVPILMAR